MGLMKLFYFDTSIANFSRCRPPKSWAGVKRILTQTTQMFSRCIRSAIYNLRKKNRKLLLLIFTNSVFYEVCRKRNGELNFFHAVATL